MINRTLNMIFGSSGQPVPTEEEVKFEAREMVQRNGWGLPLIAKLRKVADPYWREAITRCLMNKWNELVRNKDERTYYYDSDGDIRYCWMDAEYDFTQLIRQSTAEQAVVEQMLPIPEPVKQAVIIKHTQPQVINNYYINQNNGPIITDSNVTIH